MPYINSDFDSIQKYNKLFSNGLSAVSKDGNYYHVRTGKDGYEPAYSERYLYAGPFKEGLAGVRDDKGCFHIHLDGRPAYIERYDIIGEYKEGFCVVVDVKTNKRFHILKNGRPAYQERYDYASDFCNGIATVTLKDDTFGILSDGTKIDIS